MAVSPPPTMASSLPRKSAPSQVAQAETPPTCWNFFSEGMFSHLAEAPVAMISASAMITSSPEVTLKGREDRSTAVTSAVRTWVPKRTA
jgi:hypothetical protein